MKSIQQLSDQYKQAVSIENYKDIISQLSNLDQNEKTTRLNDLCMMAVKSLEYASKSRRISAPPKRYSHQSQLSNAIKDDDQEQPRKKKRKKLTNPFPWTENSPQIWVKLDRQEYFSSEDFAGWNGAVVEEINLESQYLKISGEIWSFAQLNKFADHFQKEQPNLPSLDRMEEEAVSSSSGSGAGILHTNNNHLEGASLNQSMAAQAKETKTVRDKHLSTLYARRSATMLTFEQLLKELTSSEDFDDYFNTLITFDGWQGIFKSALESYHLIEVGGFYRMKTNQERKKEYQYSLKNKKLKKVIENLSDQFLTEKSIHAYGKKISLMDLLCQTSSLDVVKVALSKLAISDQVTWMHFAMSNQHGIEIALELAKSFPEHDWRVEGLPPVLYYYLIEQPIIPAVSETIKSFLSLVVNKESSSYRYEKDDHQILLWSNLIEWLIKSPYKKELAKIISQILNNLHEDGGYLFWKSLLKQQKYTANIHVFMLQILIEGGLLTKDKLHDIITFYPIETHNDYAKLQAVLNSLDLYYFQQLLFLLGQQDPEIMDDELHWVIAQDEDQAEQFIKVVQKNIPKWHVLPQMNHIATLINFRYKRDMLEKLTPWIKGFKIPLQFLTPLRQQMQSMIVQADQVKPDFKQESHVLFSALNELGCDLEGQEHDNFYQLNQSMPMTFRCFIGHTESLLSIVNTFIIINKINPLNSNDECTLDAEILIRFNIFGKSYSRKLTKMNLSIHDLKTKVLDHVKVELRKIVAKELNYKSSLIKIDHEFLTLLKGGDSLSSNSIMHKIQWKKLHHDILFKLKLLNNEVYCKINKVIQMLKNKKIMTSIARVNSYNHHLTLSMEDDSDHPKITLPKFNHSKDTNFIPFLQSIFNVLGLMAKGLRPQQILRKESILFPREGFDTGLEWVSFSWPFSKKSEDSGVKLSSCVMDKKISLNAFSAGLKKSLEGVSYSLGHRYPYSFKPITEQGIGLVCSHVFAKEVVEKIQFIVKRKVNSAYKREVLCFSGDVSTVAGVFKKSGNLIKIPDSVTSEEVPHPFLPGDILDKVQGRSTGELNQIIPFSRLCRLCKRPVLPPQINYPRFISDHNHRFFTILKDNEPNKLVSVDYCNEVEQEPDIEIIETTTSLKSNSGSSQNSLIDLAKNHIDGGATMTHQEVALKSADVVIKKEPEKKTSINDQVIDLTL